MEMNWIIQIFDIYNDKYVDYIMSVPKEINGYIYISGSYFGSSTRQGNIGTFYYHETNEILPLSIRILNEKKEIVATIELNKNIIESIISTFTRYKLDNYIILYRDLHRFENYPYEISGIGIKL
jgi:hypothetical protein